MSNMSYCRFQNVAIDLDDCLDAMTDELSRDEHNARIKLIKLAKAIVEEAEFNPDLTKPYKDTSND